MYGTSGHSTRAEGLVIENHPLRRSPTDEPTHIKSIADPARTVRTGSVHFFVYDDGRAVDENHQPIDRAPFSLTPGASCSRLRINHYFMKSEEEYRRKKARGTAHSGKTEPDIPEKALRRRVEAFNQYRDTTITMYLPELREALRTAEERRRRSFSADR